MSKYEVEIIVNDKPIQVYRHEGSNYIEGRKGSNFSLRFKNNTSEKVLAIPSVDGISTINGQPASNDSSGYVIRPWGQVTIPGWKLSNSEVASFVFSEKEKSYAAVGETADTTNVGCIGFIVYSEDAPEPVWRANAYTKSMRGFSTSTDVYYGASYMMNVSNASSNSLSASASASTTSLPTEPESHELGTGFGEAKEFNTTDVEFKRKQIEDTIVIYYDSKRNLEKMGIVIKEDKINPTKPNPFPGNGCKPPVGWTK